ncbi:MAG: DNA-binding protein [Steroidobacteraceae bacterium]
MEYDFVLKFRLPEGSARPRDLVERLGKAGCDDAVVGIGQPGRIALDFTREAGSAEQAIISALEDVKRAIPGAELIEACPDFAGLTDIAELVGVTRQNMRKLMLTHTGTFPAPVHDGSTALWHLAPVLEWLSVRAGYAIEQRLLETARITMHVNVTRESHRLGPPLGDRIRALVA